MGHSHKWQNYGSAAGGTQQQVCGGSKGCGQLRNVRVRASVFHTHSFPVGRRGSTVECACGKQKRI